MFKQLRNRFLVLNLVIISIMMIISFTSIYLITYKNVRNDISMEMSKVSDFNKKPDNILKEQHNLDSNNKKEEHRGERSISFTLIIDNNKKIINSFSIFDMDEKFYESAKDKALSENSSNGRFKLEDTYWEFVIKESPEDLGYKMVFLDVTSRYSYLTNLIYTFSAVALVTLIAIYFISRFFANKSIKPIKETFDRQKQFVADASHELKTPLAVINTNADVLLSNSEDTIINQSKWIYFIKSEVERMTKLTNDLLYLAKADNSDMKLISTDFDLSETIENVILTMEASIFENNMVLDYNIEPNVISHGNSEQIKQVVMILLDNALKYTNPEGKISLSFKKYNNKAILKISNTGKGISEEHLDKIFDRFYCVDKSRSKNSGGYGLGLSIAKAIVEQHNGKISVKSSLNENTTFTVELPRVGNK
ncbi:sensor histidine kinase [Clostridium magnum]|uniref:histidine kinase n=1 Tax=Clostridium magnum DSM 2767 TaxID=1121326 RepID=A0A162RB39_9CLOT|nr:HAMP domain-containing sensor histidine kinase [Clostridium magnum]KZL89650.1 alkaline phosphatase synthesis sensor protein PhoR [Clostridium magnum DSM 2767]SHH75331.1 His Kinase A (phospho-acceptor) domain-containing protein [Clostridium magnum DSM 2767]